MNTLQLFFIGAACCLVSWVASEGIVAREYLPSVVPVVPRRTLNTQAIYKPSYNPYQQYYPQYTPSYYHQYTPSYYPQYSNGYQQPAFGQHITTGTSLGLSGLGLGGYYPNLNVDLVTALKPKVDVIDTVYDANGGYVYAKKK